MEQPAADAVDRLIYPFDQIQSFLGKSKQANYLCDYLKYFHPKTILIERDYVDKDYLIDFSSFYARSFNVSDKWTVRVHVFKEDLSEEHFLRILSKFDENEQKGLQATYLGFIVVKPVKDSFGEYYIGRTCLRTYDKEENGERREYLTQNYNVSLFGIQLTIESLPFQSQDSAVGGCATTACWVALHPLHSLFGSGTYSPYEVTEMSVFFPNLNRNFPSSGLTLFQMKSHFNNLRLETEFIDPNKIEPVAAEFYSDNDDIVSDAVRAYTSLGLPVIAGILLYENNEDTGYREMISGYHACVICGFRHKNGSMKELYVHDDQIGPFHRVYPVGSFSNWMNEWITKLGKSKIEIFKLIVPIYPKLRLSFGKIYSIYLKMKRELEEDDEGLEGKMELELFLISLNRYKRFLWKHSFDNKTDVMRKHLPRFLWIIRSKYVKNDLVKIKSDYAYDGTSVYPIKLFELNYK